jgi:hypothetical protein
MASLSNKSGKCSNFGNCSLADARTAIEVPSGVDFVCTECGKPLLLTDAGGKDGGNSKALIMGVSLLVVVLAIAGIGWSLLTRSKTPPPAPPAAVAPSAADSAAAAVSAAVSATKAAAKTQVPPPSASGHCSEADERAGLCRVAR